ncbi:MULTISPECIES: preprotein translocase subunit YajC [Allobacillus]|uniref:Preprotein translocase subunit YajC n=1 Tax=Allobacillus halotolerans TaxID=570278 RepID=A0ABS6GPR6_9BACI|nr:MULTISPECIES: preprotein translocase subunit YajC [Allobacillus]MBU6080645.1 preprotein translocase subunit YajC [Allobacillus halotolerans]TSJ68313.1 preprotein translocase subunit YajC [Allobacillus sp. SKP2-8]
MEALTGLLPIVLFIVLFWFILIRPQQKRQKQVREMQNNLQKGDEIVTIGGMHGRIHALDEGTIVLEVNDGNKLTYDRTSVREVKNNNQ